MGFITANKKLIFLEATAPELSTVFCYRNTGGHSRQGHTYDVETISLFDLLDKYEAPKKIDYSSIDNVGSKMYIITNFDFKSISLE